MRTTTGIIAFFGVLLGLCGAARAHPLLDDGIASYERADFSAALRTFDAAAADADLSIDELVRLFEMRALVHHAIGDRAAMLEDLRRVVVIRPDHELSRLAPPPAREAFAEMVEMQGQTVGVELAIEEESVDGMPFVVAHVERIPAGLVDHTSLECRFGLEDERIVRTSQGRRVRLPLPTADGHNGCDAAANTRRGEVLFAAHVEGTRAASQPNIFERSRPGPATDTRMSKKKKKWLWIAAGLTVAVAGGVTAGVLLSKRSKSSDAQAGAVTVSW